MEEPLLFIIFSYETAKTLKSVGGKKHVLSTRGTVVTKVDVILALIDFTLLEGDRIQK